MVGTVSSVIELGTQELDDGKMKWDGTEAEKQAILDDPSDNSWFAMGEINNKEVECKFWKSKPQPCVAITVDFPQVIVDKGQFYGDSNPAPLRLVLNGEWRFLKLDGSGFKEPLVNSLFDLKETTKKLPNKAVWSLNPKSVVYRLGKYAGLLGDDLSFTPDKLDQLLGKAFQFETEVYIYESGANKYLNERIKLIGEPAEGVEVPVLDKKYQNIIEMNSDNDEQAVKELRASIKNTMKRSSDYAGSKIEALIGEATPAKAGNEADSSVPPAAEPEKKPEAKPLATADLDLDDDDFDDDIPF
jgi:hypothetical protein